ncbi:MAG: 1-deoxy-D-xylulose-5-phosphate reductoisomerase [Clostridiales bacterium]|nr:1-deoxy-D-xylulose-5-phosphate reductoisomerase [Clostridiales bacterium]
MRKISIIGSTGSIGAQALEVARESGGALSVVALAADKNVKLLEEQILKHRPRYAAMLDAGAAAELRRLLFAQNVNCEVFGGAEGVNETAALPEADITLNAASGGAGLGPSLAALRAGKTLALANKETLVCAGELVMELSARAGASIIPVDSEHSAVFQCLKGSAGKELKSLILTASGGPFRGYSKERLQTVTREQALCHPNWSMGRKITVDSATMMNKGLEVIEAARLFGVSPGRIKVVVHPQSVVHSMAEFSDGAVLAQLAPPDMRLPIGYALHYPERAPYGFGWLDFTKLAPLTFEPPDRETFPCLALAEEALEKGGTAPAILNYANERAVARFLAGEVRFIEIPEIISREVETYNWKREYCLEDIEEIARSFNLGSVLCQS